MNTLVWFRNDLRIADNPALAAASASEHPVVAVFVLNPDRRWALGGASRIWLHESLQRLSESLLNLGITLLCRQGQPATVLSDLVSELDVAEVHWNRDYDPEAIHESTAVKNELRSRVSTTSHAGALLIEPFKFLNKSGEPYKVFTPFWNALRSRLAYIETPSIEPKWRQSRDLTAHESIAGLELLSGRAWEQEMIAHWKIGEQGAMETFEQFIDLEVIDYDKQRDFPARSSTSRLSPYLHFGELSVQRVWSELTQRLNTVDFAGQEAQIWAWLRQLTWREFSHHLLFHFPHSAEEPLNGRFSKMQWLQNDTLLNRWQRGETGYPLVDAGMRQLWQTGWMHNRVRMVTASFLTKHLGVHWLEGARWFWDTLVDADLANNTMGWQWVAGCGADAAPYYRIFNPTLQSQKFDPKGEYIRRWVPELESLDAKEIHEPGRAVSGGKVDYPQACVNHREARQAALDRYQEIRG